MSETRTTCQSCGMTIEAGPYCIYCLDENGDLQAFEERLERMQQFLRRREPELDDAKVRARTLDYMAKMPAWRDHPDIVGR